MDEKNTPPIVQKPSENSVVASPLGSAKPLPAPPVDATQEVVKPKRIPKKILVILIVLLIVVISASSYVLMQKTAKEPPAQKTTKQIAEEIVNNFEKPLAEQHGQLLLVGIEASNQYEQYVESRSYLYDLKDNKVSFLRKISETGRFWWSPNAENVVVIEGQSLFLSSVDTLSQKSKLYTTDSDKEQIGQVLWSRDGSAFVFVVQTEVTPYEEYRIKLYKGDLSGKKAELVTTITEKFGLQLREYDSNKKEIYLHSDFDPRPTGDATSYRILSATDGSIIRKFGEENINLLSGVFSDDFSRAYFTDKGSLYEYSLLSKEKRLLYTPKGLTIDEIGAPEPYIYGAMPSPNGDHILVTERNNATNTTTDFIMDVANLETVRIPDVAKRESGNLNWSPEGNFVCCYYDRIDINKSSSYYYFDVLQNKLITIPFDFTSLKNKNNTEMIGISWTTRE